MVAIPGGVRTAINRHEIRVRGVRMGSAKGPSYLGSDICRCISRMS
jgi:hypothetical protein